MSAYKALWFRLKSGSKFSNNLNSSSYLNFLCTSEEMILWAIYRFTLNYYTATCWIRTALGWRIRISADDLKGGRLSISTSTGQSTCRETRSTASVLSLTVPDIIRSELPRRGSCRKVFTSGSEPLRTSHFPLPKAFVTALLEEWFSLFNFVVCDLIRKSMSKLRNVQIVAKRAIWNFFFCTTFLWRFRSSPLIFDVSYTLSKFILSAGYSVKAPTH